MIEEYHPPYCTIPLATGKKPGTLEGVVCSPGTNDPMVFDGSPASLAVQEWLEEDLAGDESVDLQEIDDKLVVTLTL